MKIAYLVFFLVTCFDLTIHGQTKEYVLVGTISTKDKLSYPYKLVFTDSANTITGYSVTDPQGPDRTKSAIKGTIHSSKKEFNFRELNILDTRSAADENSFCFLDAHLKLKDIKGVKLFKGKFKGLMADGATECAQGDIALFSKEDALARLMKLNPSLDTIALNQQIKNALKNKIQTNTIQLSPGKSVGITSTATTATIEIWDDEKIDGDIVSVLHNGKTILDHYAPDTSKKQLHIQLRGDTDTIMLKAISEGAIPPNTSQLKLSQGGEIWLLNAHTTIDHPSYIILRRKHGK